QVPADAVDEQKGVGSLSVAKVFGHREAGEADAGTRTRWLVHLSEHERRRGEHARVLHLVIHVVALAGPLTHTREHRPALVLVSDVADELLHDHGLACARSTEESDLRAFCKRADEIDHLDPGLQDLDLRLLLRHGWGGAVDGPARDAFGR